MAQGGDCAATRPPEWARTGRTDSVSLRFSPKAGAAPVAPGSAVPLFTTSVGHVFQGPGEASSAAGAREAATRRLPVSALLFCSGRNHGVDHD